MEFLLEGRSSGGPNSRDVNVYNHLMGKFSWEFIADNFDKNKTRSCRREQSPYHYPFRYHRFIGLFFDSKMVAEVLIFRENISISFSSNWQMKDAIVLDNDYSGNRKGTLT